MKSQFLPPAIFALLLFISQSVQAQTRIFSYAPGKHQYLQSPDGLTHIKKPAADSLSALFKSLIISPDRYVISGKDANYELQKTNPHSFLFLKGKPTLSFHRNAPDELPQPNAGSADPGIFYAPVEPAEPAAIIIKPLKNLDPKMATNPDSFKKRP